MNHENQPSATVEEIARIIEPAVPWDEKAPLYGVADFETRRAAALKKARQIATLHTPPPVATATVVDAAVATLREYAARIGVSFIKVAATPTPPAEQ